MDEQTRASLRDIGAELTLRRSIVVMSGAGASAESGVPTFRDALTGLWAKHDPARLATPEAYARDPALVTRWYDDRRQRAARCEPNAGHIALARMQETVEATDASFTLITQNVDGLHQRAGSQGVIELHGSLRAWREARTGQAVDVPDEPFAEFPPRSPGGEPLRPGVVWFGETLPMDAIEAAGRAVDACDALLSIGTSSVVYPAAGFIEQGMSRGAFCVEINPGATPLSRGFDVSVRAGFGESMPTIVDAMTAASGRGG